MTRLSRSPSSGRGFAALDFSPLRGEKEGMRGPDPNTAERSRRLRRDQTGVEGLLWSRIRNRQVAGAKFVRQEPIGPYVADFACRELMLVVELDGSQHAESERDAVRDAFMAAQGYEVLRFWNEEVKTNLPGVLDTILARLEARVSLSPRSRRAGGGQRSSRTSVRPGEGDQEAPPTKRKGVAGVGEGPKRINQDGGASSAPHPVTLTRDSTSPRSAGRRNLASLLADLGLRGELLPDAPLAPLSWFRTGGPAEILFTPADEADLALFLAGCPAEVPLFVVGLGSNLLVRDGGVEGVVIRLGRGFAGIAVEPGFRVRVGAGAPDVKVARAAAEAGIDGLAFLRGIPGTIGGALRMNGGAYGGETADVLVEARALDRAGCAVTLSRAEMGFGYRHCGAPDGLIFVEALFEGRQGEPAEILARMGDITERRSATQPVNTRTGGSTFANPPGDVSSAKAWELIDAAGCRGLRRGAAQVSELHCNFLVNHGGATAAEIEGLGEEVRHRVRETSGVELRWEIRRVGRSPSEVRQPPSRVDRVPGDRQVEQAAERPAADPDRLVRGDP